MIQILLTGKPGALIVNKWVFLTRRSMQPSPDLRVQDTSAVWYQIISAMSWRSSSRRSARAFSLATKYKRIPSVSQVYKAKGSPLLWYALPRLFISYTYGRCTYVVLFVALASKPHSSGGCFFNLLNHCAMYEPQVFELPVDVSWKSRWCKSYILMPITCLKEISLQSWLWPSHCTLNRLRLLDLNLAREFPCRWQVKPVSRSYCLQIVMYRWRKKNCSYMVGLVAELQL